MMKKLKIKLILLSMISLFVLLSIIVVGMNIINYTSVVAEADEILALLSQNQGRFPGLEADPGDSKIDRLPPHMSPELPYETRYFSVLMTDRGKVVSTETGRIAAVDSSQAISYAQTVMEGNRDRGFADQFRFVRTAEGDTVRITFLDCGRRLSSFRTFLFTSAGIALAGLAIVFLVIVFFAGRIIRPISESYEKQKRFITDAGHEMKTPLTVINANVDLLEMEIGAHEALTDIQQQAKRLSSLTHDLVYLARMEEAEGSLQMIEFPVSEIVHESATSFKAPAQTQGKELVCNIQPLLSMKGNAKAIGQLVSVLMDNALKYSPAGGSITLDFAKQHRALVLTVINTTEAVVERETLSHVFDRFYRADPSRNSETGGHGIGLSVAKAIVTAHNGKIQAFSRDAFSFGITVMFPIG